jgi:hypothetical protein
MSTPWRITLAVALVLIGVGGGTCALRTARMIQLRAGQPPAEQPASPPDPIHHDPAPPPR